MALLVVLVALKGGDGLTLHVLLLVAGCLFRALDLPGALEVPLWFLLVVAGAYVLFDSPPARREAQKAARRRRRRASRAQ